MQIVALQVILFEECCDSLAFYGFQIQQAVALGGLESGVQGFQLGGEVQGAGGGGGRVEGRLGQCTQQDRYSGRREETLIPGVYSLSLFTSPTATPSYN